MPLNVYQTNSFPPVVNRTSAVQQNNNITITMRIILLTRCPNVLNDMSVPMSSPIAISAMPSTATAVMDNDNKIPLQYSLVYFIIQMTSVCSQ